MTLAFLGVLMVGALVIWREFPRHELSKKTASLTGASSISLKPFSQESRVTEVSAKTLLAEFYLTGDDALLEKAQTIYPMDVDVILASCMEARVPDSVHLNLLETLDPDNALPNLIRAGMYAGRDMKRFAEELKKAVGKPEIHTGIQSRQAEMLRILKERGEKGISEEVLRRSDQNYQHHFSKVYVTMADNLFLFDDAMSSNDTAMKFASQLRKNAENSYSYAFIADQLEWDLLKKLEASTGMVDAQRKEVLGQRLQDEFRAKEKADALLFSPSSQATMRYQFLEVMSSKGEAAAVKWLMKQ